MRRWIFQCRWFTVRLHKTQLPDEYRAHNHPWSFVSVILRGRYEEVLYTDITARVPFTTTVRRRRFIPVFRHKDAFHRVIPVGGPSWSLVVTGPKRVDRFGDASWGFLHEGQVVPWRQDALTDTQRAIYGHETPEV